MKKRKQSLRIFPDKDAIIDGQRKQAFLLQINYLVVGFYLCWFLKKMLWLDTIQILKYMITLFLFSILESQPIILATDINTVVVLLGYKLPLCKGMAGILEISNCILLLLLVPVCPFQSTVQHAWYFCSNLFPPSEV